MSNEFVAVFQALKAILKQYEPSLKVKTDDDQLYYLDTHSIDPKNKKSIFFAMVQIKKNYVSYHLFPLYACPELNDLVPAALQKNKQGKACFNFKKVDADLFAELATLTAQGFNKFREKQFIK